MFPNGAGPSDVVKNVQQAKEAQHRGGWRRVLAQPGSSCRWFPATELRNPDRYSQNKALKAVNVIPNQRLRKAQLRDIVDVAYKVEDHVAQGRRTEGGKEDSQTPVPLEVSGESRV
jgi:hypothetical protein